MWVPPYVQLLSHGIEPFSVLLQLRVRPLLKLHLTVFWPQPQIYALYNRNRKVLLILLVLCVLEVTGMSTLVSLIMKHLFRKSFCPLYQTTMTKFLSFQILTFQTQASAARIKACRSCRSFSSCPACFTNLFCVAWQVTRLSAQPCEYPWLVALHETGKWYKLCYRSKSRC